MGESVADELGRDARGWTYRYVGKWGCRTDLGTGLVYMRQRWYHPATQRFLSRDALKQANRYLYASNIPTSHVDPSGLIDLPDWVKTTLGFVGDLLQAGGKGCEWGGHAMMGAAVIQGGTGLDMMVGGGPPGVAAGGTVVAESAVQGALGAMFVVGGKLLGAMGSELAVFNQANPTPDEITTINDDFGHGTTADPSTHAWEKLDKHGGDFGLYSNVDNYLVKYAKLAKDFFRYFFNRKIECTI